MSRRPAGASAPGRARPALSLVALPAGAALVAGVLSGLARMGVDVPAAGRLLEVNHGALMVGGFVGTVIALERAAALARPVAYLVPLLAGAGGVALVAGPRGEVAPLLFVAAAAGLVAIFVAFLRRQAALPLAVMTLGALAWLGGNVTWLLGGWSPASVLPWWIVFLGLTVAGERLELTRFLPLSRASRAALGVAVVLALAGPALGSLADTGAGIRVTGIAIAGIGLWLVAHDTARRTLRRGGLASYAGVALVAAYAWLVLAGVGLSAWALEPGLRYDTTLHAFFLGFVFGAIFAHAPIILPAVTGLPLRFNTLFPVALVALHLSLAVRIAANVAEHAGARQAGGVLNGVAILLLVVAVAWGVVDGIRGGPRTSRTTAPRVRSRGSASGF